MRSLSAIACAMLAGSAAADTVTLAGGASRLTGTVRSIDGNGLVELASDASPAPLLLKAGTVDRIQFDQPRNAAESPVTLIELVNGDILPAAIESLDDKNLAVDSPDAGRLLIPREMLRSLQTGVMRRKAIYTGPNNLEEWTLQATGRENWSFDDGSLVANGTATASRKLDLTSHFIMRFTIVWQNGMVPNFKVYFADPLTAFPITDSSDAVDRYYLQFASAGIEIKRESSTGKRGNSLLILTRSHTAYPDNRLHVELRVNRDTARMELLLNGESEGEIADPIPMVPKGNGIAFHCAHREGSIQQIRDIEILENDDSRARHRAEDRGDDDTDSLITRDDSRWSGKLEAIREAGGERIYLFKGGNDATPKEIPEQEISTVFIAGKTKAPPANGAHHFNLRLHPLGSLTAGTCVFNDQGIAADHPLLGPLTLRRDGIAAIERIQSEAKAKP